MSEFKTASMENRSSGSPSFTQGLNVGGADVTSGHAMSEYHTGATEPSSPANGAFWWNGTDLHQYISGKFRILDVTRAPSWFGGRGIFAGGRYSNNYRNNIEYITIDTPSNSTDFGDLTVARRDFSGCSSGSRGVFASGESSSNTFTDIMDYITIATPGNATDFGDLVMGTNLPSACSGD